MSRRHYEQLKNQCARINYVFDEPDCLLDVGPGKYFSEAWMLSTVWKNCDILGFEPSQKRYEDLKYDYPGILFNCAISHYNGMINGYVGDGTIGKNGLIDDDFVVDLGTRNDTGFIYTPTKIPAVSLDTINELFGPYNTIFIWADAEDSELPILKGAEEILKKNVIGLSLEILNKPIQDRNDIFSYLKQFKFRPFIDEHGYDMIFRKEVSHEHSIVI
jgi:FkbM family methyltransferase